MNNISLEIIKTFKLYTAKNEDIKIQMEKAINSQFIKEALDKKVLFGTPYENVQKDIPDYFFINILNLSYRINNLWFEDNNLFGEIMTLPKYYSLSSSLFHQIVKEGILEVRFIPRMIGTYKENSRELNTIDRLITFDWTYTCIN